MSQDPAFAALQRDLPRTLSVYPHQLDLVADAVLMVELGRDQFLEAAFLDQRLLQRPSRRAWFGFEQVAQALGDALCDAPTHFVFHIGHCGSTLLSRLLAAHVLPAADPGKVAAAASSPAVGQYSKAPEHAYDAGLRRRVLADAESRFASELRAGLDWLERAAGRFPAIAAALERFGGAGG